MLTDPFVFLPPIGLALLGIVVLVQRARSAVKPVDLHAEMRIARQHAVLTAALGTGVFLACTGAMWIYAIASSDLNGNRIIASAPLLGAAAAIAVLAAGEALWPRPVGPIRTATLRTGNARTVLVASWVAITLATVAAFSGMAAWFVAQADSTGARLAASPEGPFPAFPGWFYVAPQILGVAVATALALWVARAAWIRPAVVSADPQADLILRRASTVRGFRFLLVATLLVAAGDLYIAQNAYGARGEGSSVFLVYVAVCLLGALVALMVPGPRLQIEHAHKSPRTGAPRHAVDHP